MKYCFGTLIFLFFSVLLVAQSEITEPPKVWNGSKNMRKDSSLHGIYHSFHKKGKVKAVMSYQNGLKHGTFKEYSPKGVLLKEENYRNDVLNGVTKTYFLNGELMTETHFEDGLKHGTVKTYFPPGHLWIESVFDKGLLHGISRKYYQDGKVGEEESFQYGLKHGEFKEFYPSGKLMRKQVFINNKFQSSHFYNEFDRAYLIADKDMLHPKEPNLTYLKGYLYSYFSPILSYLGENDANVYIKLTIGTNGKVNDLRLINIKSESNLLKASKQMHRLAKKLPLFIPAKKEGVPVESTVLVLMQTYEPVLPKKYMTNLSTPLRNPQLPPEAQPFMLNQSSFFINKN